MNAIDHIINHEITSIFGRCYAEHVAVNPGLEIEFNAIKPEIIIEELGNLEWQLSLEPDGAKFVGIGKTVEGSSDPKKAAGTANRLRKAAEDLADQAFSEACIWLKDSINDPHHPRFYSRENQPDARFHNPKPKYLRDLIARTGFSQRKVAQKIGVSERSMRQYLADRDVKTAREMPYVVQYALERLANNG